MPPLRHSNASDVQINFPISANEYRFLCQVLARHIFDTTFVFCFGNKIVQIWQIINRREPQMKSHAI